MREEKRIQLLSWRYRPDWTSVSSFSIKKSSNTPGCSRRTETFGYLQHPLVGLVVSVNATTVPLKQTRQLSSSWIESELRKNS